MAVSASAGEIRIRLVDAATRTPLEYWEKTVDQPELGNTLYWRMPKQVAVDGRVWPYAKYGSREGDLLGAPGGGPVADVETFLNAPGTNAAKTAEERSDRSTEITSGTGTKALVTGEVGDGEHVLHPGSIAFRIANGAIVEAAAPLLKKAADALTLSCLPVDISLPPSSKGQDPVEVACLSGEVEIFRETFPPVPATGLRLYLPVSAAGYALKLGRLGSCRFTLDDAGVHLQGAPALAEGLRVDADRLAITLTAEDGTAPRTARTEPDTGSPELYVFTDRNRSVFAEGERVEISLRAWGVAGDDRVTLALDQGGAALELAPQVLVRSGSAAAAEITLDSRALRPGTYRLRAKWGGIESNPLDLLIAPIVPETNMKLFGFTKWTRGSYAPSALAPLARAGLNLLVTEGEGGWDRARPATVTNRPAVVRGPHCPPELLEPPGEHDAGAGFLLAHGIETVPIASGLVLYFNVGDKWKNHADDRNQSVQYLGQEWRRFPNFRGIVHCTGDGPTPVTLGTVFAAGAGSFDLIHSQRLRKLREAFDFKVGKLKIDDTATRGEFERINGRMQGAVGFGVGMDAGLKVEGDDSVKAEWVRWLNDLYPDCFREERRALSPLIDRPIVNCSHTWGPGAGGGMWEESFYRNQDHPIVDIHGDYGIMPLSYSSGSDVLCMGQRKRPWIVLDLLPERPLANGMKLFLEALSRNPAGIGAMNGGMAGGWSQQKGPGERMITLMNLAHRFGDVFRGLERRDELAVLASFRQDAIAGQPEAAIWGAHFLATKAGYQANVVTEEECLREPQTLSRFKAVFLVDMTVPPPTALAQRLTAFQAAGGLVLADERTKLDLPNLVRVPLTNMLFANQVDFRAAYGRFEPLIQPFQAAVAPKLKPFFESSARHVHLVRSVDGDLEYWTLFNDMLQSADEGAGGHFAQFLYKGLETDLKARRTGVLYDAFRRQPVQARCEGDSLAWHADLRYLPGTVYVCADRPIASLSVTAPRRTGPGSVVRFKASALDAQGKAFTGKLPVEVLVLDPQGTVRYRLYRTTNRDLMLKIAGNDPAGRWTWTVTDQAAGLTAGGEFTVEGKPVTPTVEATRDVVCDGWAIGAALREREFDVVLYPNQAALRETADALVAALREAGAKVSLRVIGPADERRYPMNWDTYTVEDEELQDAVVSGQAVGWRTKGKNKRGSYKSDLMTHGFYSQYAAAAERVLYRNVILMGRAGVPENPLFHLITQRTRMLPRNPSPGFPAPGHGFAAYAWGPFHYGHDAVVLYGADEAGLRRGVSNVVALVNAPPARPASVWRQSDEWGQTYGASQGGPAGDEQTVKAESRVVETLLPDVYDQRILDARVDGDRLLIRQETPSDPRGPVLASVDLKTGVAKRMNSDLPAFRRATLDTLARSDSTNLAAPLILRTDAGRVMPVGRGVALVDAANAMRWYYDPFPGSRTLAEAQYPRLCHRLALSRDGKTIAAGFYDLGAGGSYGPKYRQFNDAVVALIDVLTGREICRCPGYLANELLLADDGSRCFILDTADFEKGRERWNPHGEPTFAVFDRQGRELFAMPAPAAAGMAVNRHGSLAVVTYNDTRGSVSVVDVEGRKAHVVEYPRMDVGGAVAADRAVIAYADGFVRSVAPDGRTLFEKKMPAPGVPVVADDGAVFLCGDDGNVQVLEGQRAPVSFGKSPVETLTHMPEGVPPGLLPPTHPFWQSLPASLKPDPLPFAAGVESIDVRGEKELSVDVPVRDPLDTVLLAFQYRLVSTQEALTVTMPLEGGKASFLYPFSAEPRFAAIPIRRQQTDRVALTFSSVAGARVDRMALLRLRTGDLSNAALAGIGRGGGNVNTPRLVVPNIHGCFGDPRVEQYAYAFPKGRYALPADVRVPVVSDVMGCFDGRVYAGTPLYPTVYPGHASWDPVDARPTLRSAQVVMEFAKPRTIRAVGIWEHPNDRPVSAFALDYATKVKDMNGDWKLAVEGRDNTDYYHLHALPKPVTARYWRYTVLETPCPVQRVAEIELYESPVDALEEGAGAPDAPGL